MVVMRTYYKLSCLMCKKTFVVASDKLVPCIYTRGRRSIINTLWTVRRIVGLIQLRVANMIGHSKSHSPAATH